MIEYRPLLRKLPILQFLRPELRDLVENSFVPITYSFGSKLVSEGDSADAFFVLASGRARVVKTAASGEEVALNTLRPGDSFGEAALLGNTGRSATVRASSEVTALRLDKSVFAAILRQSPELQECFQLQVTNRELGNFFRQFSAFTRLPPEALASLIRDLEIRNVEAGEIVVRRGDPSGPMYVVAQGRLRAFIDDDGQRRYLNYYRRGDYFGEISLMNSSPRTASVEAVSRSQLYTLNPKTLTDLLAAHPKFRRQLEERIAQYDYKRSARVPLDFADEMLPAAASVHDLNLAEVGGPDAEPVDGENPFTSQAGQFSKKSRRIRRFPHVRQIDEMDCGAASLAMVCRHYGRTVSLARIRQLVHTEIDGTSLGAICNAATELGLAARSVRASVRNLSQMPLPAIVHWEGNHWMVLYDVGDSEVRVADPAIGLRSIPRAEFEQKWTGFTALFDYTEAFDRNPNSSSSFSWLWPFFRPHFPSLTKAFALAIVLSLLQMVLPVFTQVIVDTVLVERNVSLLNTLILAMMAVLGFSIVAMIVQRYLLSFAAVRIDASTLDFLTRKLLALPMTYFRTRRTGDIQRRLDGVQRVREFMVQNGIGGISALIQLVTVLALMFVYSPVLALVFLLATPLYIGLMLFSAKWLRPIFSKIEEGLGKYNSFQIDAIKGIETVKAMAAEGAFRELLLKEFHGVARRRFNADFTIMCYEGSIQTITFLSMVLFLAVGAHQVMDGSMTIGALVAFNSLVALANAPITSLLVLWDNLQMSSVLLDRLNDVFEHEPEQGTDHSGLLPVRTLEGRVGFQNMGFRHGGPESPAILQGITLDVPAGQRVAIVGRSGSGKTTLIKCLAGIIEPTTGTILYDGVDLKTLNYRDLRRNIGFVLQENYLFDDTIARNIAFGEEAPDMDRVLWAARMANASEFIDRLPLAYDTRVGETGIAISGGQRQRIAIARALYHRPPIIVFDEATSSLDTESERALKENLDQLLQGRTSFVIAHRLSTIRDADLIVVLEKGQILERGTHDELMSLRGLYYYLCSQQLGLE